MPQNGGEVIGSGQSDRREKARHQPTLTLEGSILATTSPTKVAGVEKLFKFFGSVLRVDAVNVNKAAWPISVEDAAQTLSPVSGASSRVRVSDDDHLIVTNDVDNSVREDVDPLGSDRRCPGPTPVERCSIRPFADELDARRKLIS